MRCSRQLVASAVLSISLLANSTAASAASAAQPSTGNAWLTLSMLTPSGAAGLGGAAVAAAQPKRRLTEYQGSSTPPLPVIAVWLAVLAADVYILTRHHHHHANSPG